MLSKTFYLNGFRVRCFPRSLKLEPTYKTPLFTLSREKVNFTINTRAKTLDPVVETLDSANCTIHWIEIYPVVSATQLLNNWGQIFCVDTLVLPSSSKFKISLKKALKGFVG